MAMVIDGHEFYTTAEACSVLEVKPATLYTYVSRKLLHSYRRGIGRSRLYRRSEVESLRTFAAVPREPEAADPDTTDLPTAESWIPYT